MLTVGDKFPEFKLRANVGLEEGKQFADVTNPEGKWLVFYAYPKDFTFICPTEIVEFDKKSKDFADRDAVVIGGSTDNEFSKLAWRTQHDDLRKTKTPLAFITPSLANDLGIIHKQEGAALRVTYIVDPDRNIRSVSATDLSVGRNVDEVVRILDALQSDEHCPCNWKPGEKTLGAA
jgi:lipoyl-dependent peroxiredoxin subunit C